MTNAKRFLLIMVVSLLVLMPAHCAFSQENLFSDIFDGVEKYVKEHQDLRDNPLYERDVPVRFRRDVDIDRIYFPFDLPYTTAAIGIYYDTLSQYDRSAYFYKKAFGIAFDKEEKPALAMVLLSIIISELTAGNISEAYDVTNQVGNVWNDEHAKWAKEVSRGYIAANIGDFEGALEALARAQEMASEMPKKEQGTFGALYLYYYMAKIQGMVSFAGQDFDKAQAAFQEAGKLAGQIKKHKIGKKMPPAFHIKANLDNLIYLAMIGANQGKSIVASLKDIQAAYDEAVKIKWHWGEAQAALFLALAAEKGKDPRALEYFQRSLQVAEKKKIQGFVWQSYFHIGLLYLKEKKYSEAITNLQAATAIIESMRSKVEHDAQKTSFLGDKRQVYEALAEALVARGDIQAAFEAVEKSKSRALVDLLSAKQLGGLAGLVDPALMEQEQKLFEQINALRNQGLAAKTEELAGLQAKYKTVLEQIRKASPELVSLRSVDSAGLAEIQGLLDAQTVLLEFFQTEDDLLLWIVGRDSLKFQKIALGRKDLEQKIRSVRIMMGKPKLPAVYKLLEKLNATLLGPVLKDIEGKNLILIPDGPLHYLPFAALLSPDGKFLAQRNPLYYCPSANVLRFCVAKRRAGIGRILAMGNPDLEDPVMDLPNAELEAKAIRERFPQTALYLRKEALESLGKKTMGNYDIVHFACHGQMDPVQPLLSCLRLVPDAENDGRLQAGEIFDIPLQAQLVVLSGCETGLGKIAGGDEIVGLTRGFLYAGSPTVMASLWKVDDSATSVLMTTFYENLPTMGKAQALQQAQLKTMEAKKHPYFWASFFLSGDGQ